MDKTTRKVLIVIGSILLLWACAAARDVVIGLWALGGTDQFAEQNVSKSPQVAVRPGLEIADFKVPEGFGSPYHIHFGDVIFMGDNLPGENSQFPRRVSIHLDEMLRILGADSNDSNRFWHNAELDILEQKTFTIHGKEWTLYISKGTTRDGAGYHVATVKFDGRGDPALVMVVSPVDAWNE